MDNIQYLWDQLLHLVGNPFGAAGVMGNLQAESGITAQCLEGTARKKLGMTSEEYTRRVDSGEYTQFVSDSAGYGLAQWTYKDHKAALLALAKQQKKSVGDFELQTLFLLQDLRRFSSVLNALQRATTVVEASTEVLLRYEKPADTGNSAIKKRASYAQQIFDIYADHAWVKRFNDSKAKTVLESAKARIGDPYVFGAWGEDCTPAVRRSRKRADQPGIVDNCPVLSGKAKTCAGCRYEGGHVYDCRGFTYRCLLDAGITIEGAGATSQWNTKKNWMAKGTTNDMPDLICCLFKDVGDKMSHTGLHIIGQQLIECGGRIKPGEVRLGSLDTTWTHWAIPTGLYTNDEIKKAGRVKVVSNLKKGSKGDAVKELQKNLTKLGYPVGAIDGVFGSGTLAAVKKFQTDYGLTADGIAGSATQAMIEQLLSEDQPIDDDRTLEERVAALEDHIAEICDKLGKLGI